MSPETRFATFVQLRMYNDLLALHDYLHGSAEEADFRLILRSIPLRLFTLSGKITRKMVRFVDYKVDLLQRYRAGEDIDPYIINAGFLRPIVRRYWLHHTSLDVTLDAEGRRRVSTLEDRLRDVLCI